MFVPLFNGSLFLTLLHSEWPKLYGVLAILSAIGLKEGICFKFSFISAKTLWSFGHSECLTGLKKRICSKFSLISTSAEMGQK